MGGSGYNKLLIFICIFTIAFATTIKKAVVKKAAVGCDYTIIQKGAEWNTGEPIGGGPGCDTVIEKAGNQTSYFYATSIAHFKAILRDSTEGLPSGFEHDWDTIYIPNDAVWEFTETEECTIPRLVHITSGGGKERNDSILPGALLYTNSKLEAFELFYCLGYHPDTLQGINKISGLRIHGPLRYRDTTIVTPDTFAIPNSYVFLYYKDSLEVYNCEILGWGNSAFTVYDDSGHKFICNTFGPTNASPQGVGVSYGNCKDIVFERNYCNETRQAFAGDGSEVGDAQFIWNIFGPLTATHNIDRHGKPADGDTAGGNTYVKNNSFYSNGWGKHHGRLRGGVQEDDSAYFGYNWSHYSDEDSAFWVQTEGDNTFKEHNHCSKTLPEGLVYRIPVAVISASPDSGAKGMTVTLKDGGSTDPDEGIIKQHQWNVGDNTPLINHDSTQYVFDSIGNYLIEYTVRDNYGIPASDTQTIEVWPSTVNDSAFISVWVFDRVSAADTGTFFKQFLVNNTVVWEQDIGGYQGWVHVCVNIDDYLNGTSDTVKVRLGSKKDYGGGFGECETYWDDVAIYYAGGNISNGNFELVAGTGLTDWTYQETGTYFWGGAGNSTARSGGGSLKLTYATSYACSNGDYGQVYQVLQ